MSDNDNADQLEGALGNVQGGDYRIGYGKPPKATQFRPGKSGNPNGRPKVRTDLSALLAEGLDEKVRTSSGGVEKNVSKQRALLTALVNSALKGNQKALRSLTKLAAKTGNLEAIPDYRDHIPVVTLTYEEMKEYREYPERRSAILDRAEERAFKERAETAEAMRRANRAHGNGSNS